jgi:hypothetical protein
MVYEDEIEYIDTYNGENTELKHYTGWLKTKVGTFEIPPRICISSEQHIFQYKEFDFTIDELKHHRDTYDKLVAVDKNIIYKSSPSIVCHNIQKALHMYEKADNFIIAFARKACCGGYKYTQIGFDFTDDILTIYQGVKKCGAIDTYGVHTFSIIQNYHTLSIMLKKTEELITINIEIDIQLKKIKS